MKLFNRRLVKLLKHEHGMNNVEYATEVTINAVTLYGQTSVTFNNSATAIPSGS